MKAVVSLSGGRDSATLLAKVVKEYGSENVFALSFEYGSKHPEELECAKYLANHYNVKEHLIIEIDPNVFSGSTSTLLADGEEVEKDKTYAEITKDNEGKVDTYIPARNFLFSAYVAAFAESKAEEYNDEVTCYLAQHADDAIGGAYPDCTPEFTQAISRATEISSNGKVHSDSPFINITKNEVLELAVELGVPLNHTLSCYEPIKENGEVRECGRCATCLDVKNALEKLGIEYTPTVLRGYNG